MRGRTLALAALVALAAAVPAAALLPHVPDGGVVGEGQPFRAYATVTPQVQLFGDPVTATVAVVADRKWVDPARLRVTASFEPYEPVRRPTVLRVGSGRFVQVTWTWALRCLTSPCVPRTPPSDKWHVFQFPPAHVDYLAKNGQPSLSLTVGFPAVEALSQISPGIFAYLAKHNALNWQWRIAPVAAPRYRVPPSLLFWLALALAAVFAAAGLVLAGRFALSFRRPALAVGAVPRTSLERALALFFWAREHGDDTLRRKALERVADELGADVRDLSEAAHALAWSPESPQDEEVRAISERARAGGRPEENGA